MPTCWIIAGPNGAGKTTFALEFLPAEAECVHFVNADLIAAGLSPLAPESERMAASRIFLSEIQSAIEKREDFSFETTLSGRSHLRLIRQLRASGWTIELIYLALPSVDLSILRVAERVTHGGHNILIQDIQRRFPRSLRNLFDEYSEATTRTRCYMNDASTPQLVFERSSDTLTIRDQQNYELLKRQCQR